MNRLLAVIVVLLWAGGAGAGDDEYNRATLKGLKGVWVVIGELDQDAIADGLTKQQLQTDVELRLRKVGIRVVLTQDESRKMPGAPILHVSAPMMKSESGLYAYSICAELIQGVALARDTNIFVLGTTWSTQEIGTVGKNKMVQSVRGAVGDLVDEFINAYLSVNPIAPNR